VYQRFQRGIMHYRADCQCTERVLLADWFKSVMLGSVMQGITPSSADARLTFGRRVALIDPLFDQRVAQSATALPADLASDMAGSPYLNQWLPGGVRGMARPDELPGTDLTNAFVPDLSGYPAPPPAPNQGSNGQAASSSSAVSVAGVSVAGGTTAGGGGGGGGEGGIVTPGGGRSGRGGGGGGGGSSTATPTPTPTPTTPPPAGTPTATPSSTPATPATFTSTPTDTPTATATATPTNTPPLITTSAGAANYREGSPAIAIDPGLTLTDADTSNLVGATVAITANFVSPQDVLSFTNQSGITGTYDPTTGILRLTGTSAVANYRTALQSVTYLNTSQNPSTAPRTVTFTADDGTSTNNTGSAARELDLDAVNNPPVNNLPEGPLRGFPGTDIPITGINITDVDANGGSFQITVRVLDGVVTLNNAVSGGIVSGNITGNGSATVLATGTLDEINATLAATNGVVYRSAGAFQGGDTFTLATRDLGSGGQTTTSTLSVIVNAAPSVTTTFPTSGARSVLSGATITVNFGESVTASTSSFSIECPAGTPLAYSLSAGPSAAFILTPGTPLPGGSTCTVTVIANQIHDVDVTPPNQMQTNIVFSFSVAPVAGNDTVSATGNIAISVPSNGVLGNDQGSTLVVSEVQGAAGNVGRAANTTAVGVGGVHGMVTLRTDGSFDYDPPRALPAQQTRSPIGSPTVAARRISRR
jgi:hypothetical protein